MNLEVGWTGPQKMNTVLSMGSFEEAVVELRSLPPTRQAQAFSYIHRLAKISDTERRAAFQKTGGSLTAEEADELKRIIQEGCEKIDGDWRPHPAAPGV